MRKFQPTPTMVTAAQVVFLSMAFVQTIRPIVLKYQTEILAKGQWHIRPEFATRLGDTVILDPKDSYLMSDKDFAKYDAQCKLARVNANLHVDKEEHCPLLIAEDLQRQAEHALVAAMMFELPTVTLDKLLQAGMDKYKEYVDLTLRLLAPFVKTGPAAFTV